MPFPTDMSDANLRKLTKRRMADRKALLPPDVKTSEFSAGGRAEDPLSHANHRPRRWLDEEVCGMPSAVSHLDTSAIAVTLVLFSP